MQLLEILILATLFFQLVVLFFPHRKRLHRVNWLPSLIILLIVVHVASGRFRWQMGPTYGLGFLLFLLSVAHRQPIIRGATAQTSHKWHTAKIVGTVLGWLLFVFAARSAVVSSVFQPEKLEDLKLLLEQCPVGRPTKEDYSCVLPQVKDASIIFLGDSRHYIPEIKRVRQELGVFLAQHANVRVIGFESMYGLHPFMEAESLGKAETSDYVSSTILNYNTSVPDNSKVLVTALDVDHSINHSKSKTVKYFEHLAALSSSDRCVTELKRAIPKLLSLKEQGELHEYLDGLETTFSQYRDTFSDEDWDEVSFSLKLMHASVDFQLITYKRRWIPLPRRMRIRLQEIRAEFFRKTVERAFAKAEVRKGKLLCIVGGAHAVKCPLGKGNSLIGKWTEADYFHRIHADTQGKVASILVNALSFKGRPYETKSDLDAIAYEMMDDGELLYIPLTALAEHSYHLAWSKYFSSHGPRFDGVIFLRNATWPSK